MRRSARDDVGVATLDRLPTDTAVLSPHLDDAVFSLGAAIARATEAGASIRIVTVLAGDPSSTAPAGSWDRLTGFEVAGEAAERRREEDRTACDLVGATPVWLPFGDMTYGRGAADDEIWGTVVAAVGDAQLVLAPGWPLAHPDHAWLAELVTTHRGDVPSLAWYVEQPYSVQGGGDPPQRPERVAATRAGMRWSPLAATAKHRRSKRRAIAAYATQLPHLAVRPGLGRRITRHERRVGGERIAMAG